MYINEDVTNDTYILFSLSDITVQASTEFLLHKMCQKLYNTSQRRTRLTTLLYENTSSKVVIS